MPTLSFIESPRFPEFVSYGSSGGPGFKTEIFEGHGGYEQRNAVWSVSKGRWTVSQSDRDKSAMDVIRAFFYACKGRATGFRFKDWNDFECVSLPLAAPGVIGTPVKMVKIYSAGSSTYVRRIAKPVQGTFLLYSNGTPVSQTLETVYYNVDYTTGTFTLLSGAPYAGATLTYSCEFDCPVRFDTDSLSSAQNDFATETWSNIPIVELSSEFI